MSRMTNGASQSDYLFGLNAGIFFRGDDPLTFQIEMLYSGQGGSFPDPTTGQVAERRLHYLTPMLLLRYQPIETVGVVGGLQMGVLITAREGNTNISDKYDPLDLGLSIGVDKDFLESDRFNLSFRFFQSLRRINSQVIQFSIGIRIQDLD